MSFEELVCQRKELRFEYFFRIAQEKWGLEALSTDVLKSLGFYTRSHMLNNAAGLFADENDFFGIDMVRFGKSINEILDREIITHQSILVQYDKAMYFFKKYYQYEKIDGMDRKLIELVPSEAFREALANAIVHRFWDISAHIRVAMYPDKVEICSPGGLPAGISKKEYLKGYISILRNPIVGNIFFRLGFIEMFGTGIRRIMDCYSGYDRKAVFEVSDNSICVILPSIEQKRGLSSDEMVILEVLSSGNRLASSEIVLKSGFGKNKVVRLIQSLLEKHYVQKEGNGRGTRYYL